MGRERPHDPPGTRGDRPLDLWIIRPAAHRTGVTFFRSRQAKGIPTGGQFAATLRAEPTIQLPAADAPEGLGHQDTSDMRRSALGMFRDAVQSRRRRAEDRRDTPRPKRNRAAMKVAVAALVLASAVTVTACGSNYTGKATVDGKDFRAHHSYVTTTKAGKSIIPIVHHVPDEWDLKLHDPDGKTFEIKVDHSQFDSIEQGSTVNLKEGKLSP